MHIGVVGGDAVGDVLHHHGFAAFGRRHNQRPLPAANGGNQVNYAACDVFF